MSLRTRLHGLEQAGAQKAAKFVMEMSDEELWSVIQPGLNASEHSLAEFEAAYKGSLDGLLGQIAEGGDHEI